MKKILIALTLVGFSYLSTEAQTTTEKVACGAPKDKVCKKSGGGVSCYKTKYAEDYKICKGDYGYSVCCEEPNYYNSTHPPVNTVAVRQYPNPMDTRDEDNTNFRAQQANNDAQQAMVAPQSQSYPEYAMNSATAYEGYYTGKHFIKVCYAGDNVAELNNAPYHGCATPAYDGPEKNKARNVNSNNTIDDIAPITGQIR